MAWLVPAIIGALCGTLLLLLVYIYLYHEYHERYLAIWAASWGMSALRYTLQLVSLHAPNPLPWAISEQIVTLISGFLLLWGIYAFLGKAAPRWWFIALLAGISWIIIASVNEFSFFLLTIPTFTFLGAMTMWIGLLLLRQQQVTGFPPRMTGWAFIVWGLHRLSFPFLRPVVWFAPWGFLLAALLQITAALGMILTYFQRNRQELHQSQERLHMLVTQMPVMIDAFDDTGQIVFWNQECERVTGYSAAEMCFNPEAITLLYPDPVYRQEMMSRWQERGNYYRDWEWDLTGKDGRVRTIAWSNISAQFPIPGWATWGVGVDVTERKQAEVALRQTQKMESLGILAGGIAHDFNNLLTVIMAQTSLTLRRLDAHHPLRPNLEQSLAASTRAADLIRHMLAFSGKGRVEVRPLNLNDLVMANLPLIRAGLPKQVEIQADLDESLPLVEGDSGQLQQVVMNLILNGAQAIGERAGLVRVETAVQPITSETTLERDYLKQTLPPGHYVSLTVTDDGQGMDEETRNRIFEPFFSTKKSGHGLGLSAVLGIVQGHKGGIFVQSQVGKGATFRVLLPVATDVNLEPEEVDVGLSTAVTGAVLVIDDEALVRQAVDDILTTDGIQTFLAATGEEGLALFQEHQAQIKLVLLDLSMPGMGGTETFHALRQLAPHLPVLFSSGYDQTELAPVLWAGQSVEFVAKPYQAEKLLTAVKRQLKNPE